MIKNSFVSAAIINIASAASCLALLATAPEFAYAAEVKFLSAGALTPAVRELVPQFERSSGHKVTIIYGNINALADRVEKGEAVDVVITSPARIEALIKAGWVMPTSQTKIASVGAGIAIRKGAPKPDISSADALKRTLLAAKSVSYGDPGAGNPTGIHMTKVVEQLAIAAEMAAKVKLIRDIPAFVPLFNDLRSGATELGIEQISLIVEAPNIELAGPLPTSVQSYTQFAAGLVTASTEPDAARALIQFISAPAAKAVLKIKGFDIP
jgi:molybdate transport system substrate-binding protein